MGWRSLLISNPARLSLKDDRLLIEQENSVTLPLEDVDVVVLDTGQVTVTSHLLREMAARETVLFACDDKHHPCGVYLPFQGHSRQNKILLAQVGITEPFKKRCWQKVIKQKIQNQSRCLGLLGLNGYKELEGMARSVVSGDSNNREAWASRVYFKYLLEGHTRRSESLTNGALNYGYAIFRGVIARTLAGYGFIPALGIHHDNELNGFNLADDFLEVYRPLVDLFVMKHIPKEGETLTREQRASLLGILNCDVRFQNGNYTALRSVDMMLSSFSGAVMAKNPGVLVLPELIGLHTHDYES